MLKRLITLIASPNPARGGVRFSIGAALAGRDAPAILVFSVSGRRVARIPAAGNDAAWDGRDESGNPVPSGVYFARLEDERSTFGTKFMLLH